MWYSRQMIVRVLLILLIVGITYSGLSWRGLFQILYPVYYGDAVGQYSQEYGTDPFLITAIILVESGFQERAQSKKGAIGLMQLMPDTAEWVAHQVGVELDDQRELFHPELNVQLGTWYLASLRKEFGDWVVALAAYNAGRGNVRKWLSESTWSGQADRIADIPFGETRVYVSRVMRAHQWYQRVYVGDWARAVAVGRTTSHRSFKAAGALMYWIKRIVYALFVRRI